MTNTDTTLKPCPFCGGDAELRDDPGVCDVPFGLVVDHRPGCFFLVDYSSGDDAFLAAWNQREKPAVPDTSLAAELAALQDHARKMSIALTNLSGGGSEMFTRIGEDFYADPEACLARLAEKQANRDRRAALTKPAVPDVREAVRFTGDQSDLRMRFNLDALEESLGLRLVGTNNPNIGDDQILPVDVTMGGLRRARAAIAKARGKT